MQFDDTNGLANYNDMLTHMSTWAKNWQLPLSVTKCCCMRVSNRAISIPLSLTLANSPLIEISELKDLGVIFNSKLSFTNHISAIIGKAKQRLFLLNKSFVCKDAKILITAYKTYVIPILDYCSPVWSPYYASDIKRIESVQKGFTGHLIGYSGLNYGDRLVKAGLCTLELRRLHADLVLCFKIIHGMTDIKTDSMFLLDDSQLTRGHSWKLRSYKPRLDTSLHFFAYRTVAVWNKLMPATVCAQTVQSFKTCLLKEDLSSFMLENRK